MPLAAFPKCFLEAMCAEKTMSVDEWIEMSSSLDVDGLEFYWGFTPSEDPDELSRLRGLVEAQGRSIPMMCYSSDFTHPDPAVRAGEVELQKEAIRVTAELGGGYCRVLSGQRRPGVSREDGLTWVADSIHACLDEAQAVGVTMILENHYKDGFWDYPEFAQKMDLFLELLERIEHHPNFGVNYDPSNAVVAGDDPLALLEAVKDRVVSMHASDRYFEGGTLEDLQDHDVHPARGYADILKHGVVGQGINDFDAIFSILKKEGFNGWISIEDGQDPEVGFDHLNQSAVFLRNKMAEHGLT